MDIEAPVAPPMASVGVLEGMEQVIVSGVAREGQFVRVYQTNLFGRRRCLDCSGVVESGAPIVVEIWCAAEITRQVFVCIGCRTAFVERRLDGRLRNEVA